MALTDKQLIADLKGGKYSPVYLLMGEEDYYIDTVSDWMEEHIVDPTLRDFDQTVVYGRDVDMKTVVGHCKRFPMMSPVHLVLVKEAQGIDKRQWENLVPYLQQPSPPDALHRAHPMPQERHARQAHGCLQGHRCRRSGLRDPQGV